MYQNILELMKKAKVTSVVEAADADFVVCGPEAIFPDDIHTRCSHCTAPIAHRPHAPEKSKKICIACAAIAIGNDPDVKSFITDKVAAEVVLFLALKVPRRK